MKLNIKYKNFGDNFEYKHCIYYHPFRIFYNSSQDDKSPKNLTFKQNENIPDYIIDVFKSFYEAYEIFIKVSKFRNPLEEGIYFEKGAKFIDILLVNIPVQKGLVAAELIDNSSYFPNEPSLQGSSIRILLHNELVKNSATPIHELFHVFQYNYCNFNNMWFMEGLARWSQNLIQTRRDALEFLPQNRDELEILLNKAHDSEYFWKRVLQKLNVSSKFIARFLYNLSFESVSLEKQLGYKKNSWTKEQKKDEKNNEYILKTLLNTINLIPRNPNSELDNFIETVSLYTSFGTKKLNNSALQTFFRTLKKCDASLVKKEGDILVCDSFDLKTRELKVSKLDCSNLSEYELDSFNQLLKIEGELILSSKNIETLNSFNYLKSVKTLTIKEMNRLKAINGFNSLEKVENIEISTNESLERISGFNSLFKVNNQISGYIKIIKNKNLEDISFLRGVKSVGSSFYLHHNRLKTLRGLENLESVDASFSLSSNQLESVKELSSLISVSGMLGLAFNKLKSLEGLENLKYLKTTAWNGQNRTLVIHGNKELTDISSIKNILTDELYLIFFIDDYLQYKIKPESSSTFHKNILELYDAQNKRFIPTYKFVKKERHDYTDFGKATHSKKLTYLLDFELQSDILVISFSGYNGYLGGIFNSRYPFITNELNTNKIFLLDEQNSWYHNGIKNITSNIDETIAFLKKFVDEGNYKKVVCFGASMGGYASLLVAPFIGATNVIALSAQTFLDNKNRKKYGDDRWVKSVELLNKKEEKYLDLKPLYKDFNGDNINIEIHYSKSEKLDEIHANHLNNSNITVIGYENSDHYLAVYLHKKGALENIVLNNLGIEKNKKEDTKKYRLIFGKNWKKATSKCKFLEAYHVDFKNIDEVIQCSLENGVNTLFANNYTTQYSINKNQKRLKHFGLKFIVNSEETLKRFVDKKLFYKVMTENRYEKYVPTYYLNKEDVKFPCIVKRTSGGAGKGIFIAYKEEDLSQVTDDMILSQYLVSNKEYATSIFMKEGKIVKDITFVKTANKEHYVLQHESENSVQIEYCETPFFELFEEILNKFAKDEKYCQCSINFKIEDGIPKIFEINPRIGYTLAGFCDKFKEMLSLYIDEVENLEE